MFTSNLELKTMLPVHFRILAEGRPIFIDFSPVTDLREATCRQYEENECNRGGYCNFMHLTKISRELSRKLFGRSRRRHCHNRSRSCSSHAHGMIMRNIRLSWFWKKKTSTATMIKSGLDAEVQVAEVDEAEAVGEGETGVKLGKSVWREGQNRAVE